MRDALGGSRYVGPALADLPLEHECSFSDDFLPVIRCREPSNEQRLLRLDRDLAVRVAAEPTDDQLRAKALVRLAPGPKLRDEAGRAVTYLEEALQDEEDPQRRARLLADLSGAYLLWAEETQSPIEVVAGLEAALEAEELVPGLDDAVFNRRLALVQLGVDQPEDVEDEPLLHDLAVHLADAARGPEEPGCLSISEFGERMDEWSLDPKTKGLAEIREEAWCWLEAEDRFVIDLLAAAESAPADTGRALRALALMQRAFADPGQGDPAILAEEFEVIWKPEVLRVAARYEEGLLHHMAREYETADRIWQEQIEEALERSYFALAARAVRARALVSGLAARYSEAIARNQLAAKWAERSGSYPLAMAIRQQQVDLMKIAGREEDAWRLFGAILRAPAAESVTRHQALSTGASLAQARGFNRCALHLRTEALRVTEGTVPVLRASALRQRAELLFELGRRDEALLDLSFARDLIEGSDSAWPGRESMRLGIDRALAVGSGSARHRWRELSRLFEEHHKSGNEYQLLSITLERARAAAQLGDQRGAVELLLAALDRLEDQVGRLESWREAAALTHSARPLIEELIGLLVAEEANAKIAEVLAKYFALRSGSSTPAWVPMPESSARWTLFVHGDAVVSLLEAESGIEVRTRGGARSRLVDLRRLLLTQVTTRAPRARVKETLSQLAGLVLWPAIDRFDRVDRLVIVADEVLTGLPFGLLPTGPSQGEVLLDRFPVSYATDLGALPDSLRPGPVLVVGATGTSGTLPILERAESEAREVASIYPGGSYLIGTEARKDRLLESLAGIRVLHVASHFEINTRSPLDSALLLNASGTGEGWLDLASLLRALPPDLELFYLSACDTGRGLPAASHGFHSLAQSVVAPGVRRAVVSFWPLDDEVGSELAVQFHRLVNEGISPEEALRQSQLARRNDHPGVWGSLGVIH